MLIIGLSSSEQYVAGAYVVFLALVLVYLAIMASKLGRLEREVVELAELAERKDTAPAGRVKQPTMAAADPHGSRSR